MLSRSQTTHDGLWFGLCTLSNILRIIATCTWESLKDIHVKTEYFSLATGARERERCEKTACFHYQTLELFVTANLVFTIAT